MNTFVRPALVFGLVASLAVMSACTVRPLYSSAPASAAGTATMATELSSIAIKPVSTRQAQEVRNRLIFLFGGGAGEPNSPVYSLNIGVVSQKETAASVQVTTVDQEPTAATITMYSSYSLSEVSTGELVSSGSRQITASYDVPPQEFAALRAQRDAENRAARELAELIRLAVAQDIARK